MSFSTDFVAFLKSKSTVTSLVGSGANARIRPTKLKQGDALPAIRYVVTSGAGHEDLLGPVGVRQPNLQIDCYGSTRSAAEALGDAVRDALLAFWRGTMGSTTVKGINLVNRFWMFESSEDGSDSGKHREVLIFDVVHSESIPS